VLHPISSLKLEGYKEMVPSEVDHEVEPQLTGPAPTPTCPDSSSRPGVVNVGLSVPLLSMNLCPRGQLRNASIQMVDLACSCRQEVMKYPWHKAIFSECWNLVGSSWQIE